MELRSASHRRSLPCGDFRWRIGFRPARRIGRSNRAARAESGAGAPSKNIRQQVSEFNTLGPLYDSAGQLQKALDDLNQALPIEQKHSSMLGQATTLNTMGRVYTDLGQEDKALNLLNQALPFWRALRRGRAKPTRSTTSAKSITISANTTMRLRFLISPSPSGTT